MPEFTNQQKIACAQKNLNTLDTVQELINDAFDLTETSEYQNSLDEIVELVVKLRTTTLKLKYDTEIAELTWLRNNL